MPPANDQHPGLALPEERAVVLDVETTGTDPSVDRVIEFAFVEYINRQPTGRNFHARVKPGKRRVGGSEEIHGISDAMLADKPPFEHYAGEIARWLDGAEIVAHNAAFDVAFLERELERAGKGKGYIKKHASRVTDTLKLARARFPGQSNNLAAVQKRLKIPDPAYRHGALPDAETCGRVWIQITIAQETLELAPSASDEDSGPRRWKRPGGVILPSVTVSPEERERHRERLAQIRESSGKCLWDRTDQSPASAPQEVPEPARAKGAAHEAQEPEELSELSLG